MNVFNSQPWEPSPVNLLLFSRQIGSETAHLMAIPRLGLENSSSCSTFNLQTFLDLANSLRKIRNLTAGFIITIIAFLGIKLGMLVCIFLNEEHSKRIDVQMILYVEIAFGILIGILAISPAAATATWNADFQNFRADYSLMPGLKCFTDNNAQQIFDDFLHAFFVAAHVANLWVALTAVTWGLLAAIPVCGSINKLRINRFLKK